MVLEDPGDPFPKYALAMELRKAGEDADALDWFGRVVQDHPDYVAVYYQMAGLQYDLGDGDAAGLTIAAGIAIAQQVSNAHAARELAELREDNA